MVTGAGSGIGRAYARMLVALGASIIMSEHVPLTSPQARDELNQDPLPRRPEPSACGGSSPASRSFVLPALRALHLDPECGPQPRSTGRQRGQITQKIHGSHLYGSRSQIRGMGKRIRTADIAP